MRKFLLLTFISVVACQQVSKQEGTAEPYFRINDFVNTLIQSQAQSGNKVHKLTIANGIDEVVEISEPDSAFWKTELTPLLSADINKPSLFDAYTIKEGASEETSNLLRTIYDAKPKVDVSVKRLEIKYLNKPTEVRQIIATINKDNPVYNSYQKINLWTNKYGGKLLIDSMNVTGYNKTVFQDSLVYQTKLKVLH